LRGGVSKRPLGGRRRKPKAPDRSEEPFPTKNPREECDRKSLDTEKRYAQRYYSGALPTQKTLVLEGKE